MASPTPAVLPPSRNSALPLTSSLNYIFTSLRHATPPALRPLVLALHTTLLPHINTLETRAHSNPVLIAIWRNSGIPPIGFALFACLAILASVKRMLNRTPLLLTNLVGVVYPAYSSIKAVEKPEKDDDERWLTYWSIYGLFTILDSTSKSFLSYIPLYHLPKLMLLYWLFGKDGALVVYRSAIRPFLVRYGSYGLVKTALNNHRIPAAPSGLFSTPSPDRSAGFGADRQIGTDHPIPMEPMADDATIFDNSSALRPVLVGEESEVAGVTPAMTPEPLTEAFEGSVNGIATPAGGRSGRGTPTPTASPSKKKNKSKSKSRERSLIDDGSLGAEENGDVGRDPVPAQ
ncbi:Receptor expression-enhancing protein 5 [Rhizophlyctis rosea]|uniref:Protein YOP1 n=1 Tax=Rhizophlyctis rosea TaxID=64517 RepID=A0AAD5SJU1_9FUNG|nr:Receptor expression-enhancing protein 5 [Rhizophlyctis rosea]